MERTDRLHALDAVRAFALLLGIVLHATMSFMPGLAASGWPIVDASQSTTLAVSFYVIHMFRMTAFFVIAGFFARLVVARRGVSGFWRDRRRRIGVPLVVGWLVLTPLIVAALVWGAAKSGITSPPPEPPPGTLLPFPLTHLWFLYVLLLLYALWLGLRALVVRLDRTGGMRARLDAAVGRTTSLGFAPIVLALPVASALYGYAAWIPWGGIPTPDYALVPNLPAFLAYGTAFAFGWLLHRQPDLLAHFRSAWASYLGAALVLTAHCLWQVGLDGLTETPLPTASQRAAYAASYGLGSWCWTFALTGAALRFLADERPTIRYLADASYWLYLLHLPLVFALQSLAMHWPLHWSVKFPLVVVAATAILLVSYHGIVRFTAIGAVLNGRRFPRPGAATPATAAAGDAVGTPRPR